VSHIVLLDEDYSRAWKDRIEVKSKSIMLLFTIFVFLLEKLQTFQDKRFNGLSNMDRSRGALFLATLEKQCLSTRGSGRQGISGLASIS